MNDKYIFFDGMQCRVVNLIDNDGKETNVESDAYAVLIQRPDRKYQVISSSYLRRH